jgi:hypothetical protein
VGGLAAAVDGVKPEPGRVRLPAGSVDLGADIPLASSQVTRHPSCTSLHSCGTGAFSHLDDNNCIKKYSSHIRNDVANNNSNTVWNPFH